MGKRAFLPAAAMLMLAACGGDRRRDDAPVVVSAIGNAPVLATDGVASFPDKVLAGATAQGLVRFDGAGQIEPGLAERWTVLDDGRSYIFRLRDAAWADGTPVTATQVVRALRRAAGPGARRPLAPFFAVIDEFVEMTPQVIEVRLRRPRPDLLNLFAQPEMAVLRPGRDGEGSGPFRIRAGTQDGVLLAPIAADQATPTPQEMVRLRGERAALAVARFAARDSDLVLGGTFADFPLLAQTGIAPANIRIEQPAGLFGLAVVRREGFLADVRNRAAVAMAFDRAAIAAAIAPEWAPAETLLPAKLDSTHEPAAPAWARFPADERRRTARAAAAAWARANAARPRLRIALPAGPGGTLLWGQIAAALRRVGIDGERTALDDAHADLRLIDAVAPYDSGRWYVHSACLPCAPAAAALVLAGRDAPDLQKRAQRIAEADVALAADTAFIPLARPLRWSLVALRLGGWQGNARAWHPLNHLRNEAE